MMEGQQYPYEGISCSHENDTFEKKQWAGIMTVNDDTWRLCNHREICYNLRDKKIWPVYRNDPHFMFNRKEKDADVKRP